MPGAPQKGKPSVSERAQQFLASIGTAGGPIGAPGLFTFGAGNLREQVSASQMNPYYGIQQASAGQAPIIGAPNASNLAPNIGTTTMPRDFDSGYLHLNIPGSPLPQYGLMTAHNAKAAQITQDQGRALQQHAIMPFMPLTGQLPVDPAMLQQPLMQQKGRR